MHSDLTLLGLGMAGVLLHCLIKISKLKKTNSFKFATYFSMEWPTICISAIVVAIAIVCKHEVTQLDQAKNWLGIGFVSIGYMGQSILITVMGRAEAILTRKKEEIEIKTGL